MHEPRVLWLDPVLLCGLAVVAGGVFAVAPCPALLAGFCLLGLVWSQVKRSTWLLTVGCAALGALSASAVLAAFDDERQAQRDGFGPPQRCALRGTIVTSPVWYGGRASFAVELENAVCEAAAPPAGTRVRLGGGPDDLARGDRVAVNAQLAPIELLFNAQLSNPLPFAAQRGVMLSGSSLSLEVEQRAQGLFAWIDRARAHVRRRILATFAASAQPLARALVLGENDLDPEDAAAFRKSGLAHMLAVSGTHLVFAVVALVRALTALLVRVERLSARFDVGRATAGVGIVLSLFYADFAGGSGSAYRAAFMLSAAFAARALGRRTMASRSLGLSLWVGWLCSPLVAFDISFLLSFAATAGLLLLGKPLAKPCEVLRSRVGRAIGTSIATTLAAMIPCAPLLALLSPDLTLAGVLANVLAAPLGETIALPLCLAHALLAPLPALEQGVALVGSGALIVVRHIAHESAAQTWLSVRVPDPTGYQLALCAVLAVASVLVEARPGAAARWRRVWMLSGAAALALLELATRRAGAPRGELRMTALAVGQGDATLIELPDGALMLVDGGGAPAGGADPGARVVVPTLRARRRQHVDVMVLSHPHPDHFGGLLAVLRNVSVGELWDSGQGEVEGAGPVYRELIGEAHRRGIPVRRPPELCGAPRALGGAKVHVLAPCPGFVPGRGANDNSLVLKVELGARSFLLTGDAEALAEESLLALGPQIAADVLKVGHHGSRTSTSAALLRAVAPRLATISCGTRNRFGHPAPDVSARLARAGVVAWRTDVSGSITIGTDGSSVRVSTARPTASRSSGDKHAAERQTLTSAPWRALLGRVP